MKCLVTGGAGFIGSHIVDELIENKHEVVIIDNISSGTKKNINPKAKLYKADIRSNSIDSIFKKEKPKVVFHVAAQINLRKSNLDPKFDADINIAGGLNILDNCKKYGVKKVIYSSTAAVYGQPKKKECKESDFAQPTSAYGISKYSFEKYLEMYNQIHKLNYCSLRYANVYGPRQDPNGEAGVISIFINDCLNNNKSQIFGDGKQTRDFIFVKDVSKANLLAMKSKVNGVFNISTNKETSINQIHKLITDIIKNKIRPNHKEAVKGEIKNIFLNNKLAKQNLKFLPETNLEAGLKETIEYFS